MDKFEIFEKWLLDNNAKFPKLELRVSISYLLLQSKNQSSMLCGIRIMGTK